MYVSIVMQIGICVPPKKAYTNFQRPTNILSLFCCVCSIFLAVFAYEMAVRKRIFFSRRQNSESSVRARHQITNNKRTSSSSSSSSTLFLSQRLISRINVTKSNDVPTMYAHDKQHKTNIGRVQSILSSPI